MSTSSSSSNSEFELPTELGMRFRILPFVICCPILISLDALWCLCFALCWFLCCTRDSSWSVKLANLLKVSWSCSSDSISLSRCKLSLSIAASSLSASTSRWNSRSRLWNSVSSVIFSASSLSYLKAHSFASLPSSNGSSSWLEGLLGWSRFSNLATCSFSAAICSL